MRSNKTFSVSQLSKLAGVSVRTLHHYDQNGLLKPNRSSDNGYRVYRTKHVHLLQQILIYRELGFSLEKIKTMNSAKDDELVSALAQQKSLLIEKKTQLEQMIQTIEDTMEQLNRNDELSHLFNGLPKEQADYYSQDFQDKIGEDGMARMLHAAAKMTPDQAKAMNEKNLAISKDMAALLDKPISGDDVQAVVRRHYELISNLFATVTDDFNGIDSQTYCDMALKFPTIEAMKQARDHFAKGSSEHLSEAMIYFAEQNL